MNSTQIVEHELFQNEFFLLERIEKMEKPAFEQLHRHDFYELLWFTHAEKSANHQIDFKTYPIKTGQIYILSPNQVHYMSVSNKTGYLMAFPKTLFAELDFSTFALIQPYFYVVEPSTETQQNLKILIDLMQNEFKGRRRKSLLYTYCKAFFIHIASSKENRSDAYSERIIKLLKLTESHYATHKEVKFYADSLHISERRLNEIYVKHTGKTVKQFITDRNITEAKRLIIAESFSIKEIAYKLGYTDPSYFSRLFKKKTDFTPEAFRKHQNSFN